MPNEGLIINSRKSERVKRKNEKEKEKEKEKVRETSKRRLAEKVRALGQNLVSYWLSQHRVFFQVSPRSPSSLRGLSFYHTPFSIWVAHPTYYLGESFFPPSIFKLTRFGCSVCDPVRCFISPNGRVP